MKKILIAVDDTKGSKNVLSVFQNFVQQPAEVVLLHVERLQGRSMMVDMLGDAEMSTLKEMLKGTEHKDALDSRSRKDPGLLLERAGYGRHVHAQDRDTGRHSF